MRAGDTVKHLPSGEQWTLACDEDRGRVMPCGWPESEAQASDYVLLRAATDDERMEMLHRFASKVGGSSFGTSYRTSIAKEQFERARRPTDTFQADVL